VLTLVANLDAAMLLIALRASGVSRQGEFDLARRLIEILELFLGLR